MTYGWIFLLISIAAFGVERLLKARSSPDTREQRIGSHPYFFIEYADADGVITERKICVLGLRMRGERSLIKAWCHLRYGPRWFRADRILAARDLATGRTVVDLPSYLLLNYRKDT